METRLKADQFRCQTSSPLNKSVSQKNASQFLEHSFCIAIRKLDNLCGNGKDEINYFSRNDLTMPVLRIVVKISQRL